MNERLETAMRAAMTMADTLARHPTQVYHIIAALAHVHAALMEQPWYAQLPLDAPVFGAANEMLDKHRLADAYDLFQEAVAAAIDDLHPDIPQTLHLTKD